MGTLIHTHTPAHGHRCSLRCLSGGTRIHTRTPAHGHRCSLRCLSGGAAWSWSVPWLMSIASTSWRSLAVFCAMADAYTVHMHTHTRTRAQALTSTVSSLRLQTGTTRRCQFASSVSPLQSRLQLPFGTMLCIRAPCVLPRCVPNSHTPTRRLRVLGMRSKEMAPFNSFLLFF